MKILMVSMPCFHFFRWTEQLQDSGHEIFWFDSTDSGEKVERLNWINQIVRWKLRWDYPGRFFVKKNLPSLYEFIKKFNERDIATIFEQKLIAIQPDIVHSFAMQIACIPILPVMLKHKNKKWMYSSWGSDVFYFEKLNIEEKVMKQTFERVDFLITDCNRDYEIAKTLGFKNQFLGVFPGNGGVDFLFEPIQLPQPKERDTILIKAYNDGIGKGIEIIKAFDSTLISLLVNFKIVLFGADQEIVDYINNSASLQQLNLVIYLKEQPIPNDVLLKIMSESYLYIANSLSDGLPNALLEAMGMGCFPIQSNPGNVMAEVIQHGTNGLLIENPLDINEINNFMLVALRNDNLVAESFQMNVDCVRKRCGRNELKDIVIGLYRE
jgi:glycosyltransferase involved in cell wall biosynthesis